MHWKMQDSRQIKITQPRKSKQHKIQQNKINLVQSPFTTLGQEMTWAYSTKLLSPHGAAVPTIQTSHYTVFRTKHPFLSYSSLVQAGALPHLIYVSSVSHLNILALSCRQHSTTVITTRTDDKIVINITAIRYNSLTSS